ncbi:MAG: DUF3854 domain-containing protein, partial [Chloroflexi bacterium]|nr:DUF3854 domain-containing protein [Chloroflexota bacterium]
LEGRDVRVVYDSDVVTKAPVQQALARLVGFLESRGARVRVAYLPHEAEGKTGVDDWLVAGHTVAELEGLLEPLRSRARTAPPIQVEILDEELQTLRRPLALLDGRAYAALSLPCRVSREGGENGQAAPTREWRPFVLRDDGRLFGAGADEPLEALGFAVELPPLPRNARTLSPRAVKRYREGYRPEDVAGLVGRVAGVYDHFIDFGRSLGSQGEMCRLAACLSLATYFLPAWTVIGYLWFTGEKGAGKSQAGTVWALTSYLGRVVLSSGTFAALRDLAEAGAALVFDDAEVLADPRKADPNKRELALAGNRRGVQVPLKERQGDNWVLRWVDAFAPRAFTAIARPEDVLASRCIVIPLVRTADRGRANRDAVAERYWPANAQALVDDCWMLALWLLPEAEAVWAELDGEGEVLGRDLEPWRAALATARLLDRHGAPGLEGTVRAVMARYREERADYWADDHTGAVVRVLVEYVEEQVAAGGEPRPGADTLDTLDTADTSPGYVLSASAIAQRIQEVAAAEREEEQVGEWATPTRIGITLRNLRLRKERGADRKRTRGWRFTLADVRALATAYGVQTSLGEGATPTMGGPSTAHCTPSGEVSRVSAGAHDAPGDGRQGNPSGVVGE